MCFCLFLLDGPWLRGASTAGSLVGGGQGSAGALSAGHEGGPLSWGETRPETLDFGSPSCPPPKGLLVLVSGSILLSGASKVRTLDGEHAAAQMLWNGCPWDEACPAKGGHSSTVR